MSTYPKELKNAVDQLVKADQAYALIEQQYKAMARQLDEAKQLVNQSLKEHRSTLLNSAWAQLWDIDSWKLTRRARSSFYEKKEGQIVLRMEMNVSHVRTQLTFECAPNVSIKLYDSYMSTYNKNKKGLEWDAYKATQLWAIKEGIAPHWPDEEDDLELLAERVKNLRTHVRKNNQQLKKKEKAAYEEEIIVSRTRLRSQQTVINATQRQQTLDGMRNEIVDYVAKELVSDTTFGAPQAKKTLHLSDGYEMNISLSHSWMHVKCINNIDRPLIDSRIDVGGHYTLDKVYKELLVKLYKRFGLEI